MRSAARTRELEELLKSTRSDLHRYCARLVGSVFDGEDVVQDVMEKALGGIGRLADDMPLRPWLFKIAHNRAIDLMRRRDTQNRLTPILDEPAVEPSAEDPFERLARRQAVALAVDRFTSLPPMQRSIVILKDVLGETNADIALSLGLSLQSVKAHLHRGRFAISRLAEASAPLTPSPPNADTIRYVAAFNDRDWNGLRTMLAEDVRLIQATRGVTAGRAQVAERFFGGYATTVGWTLRTASLLGVPVIRIDEPEGDPYVMHLTWHDGQIHQILDFRYARYVTQDVQLIV